MHLVAGFEGWEARAAFIQPVICTASSVGEAEYLPRVVRVCVGEP